MNLPVVAGGFPPDILTSRARGLKRIASEIRHHFSLASDEGNAGGWDLDIFPRLLSAPEWEQIRDGAVQRMEAFSRFTADVYGKQRIVSEGILPADVLLGVPGYYRELLGKGGPENFGFLFGAMDLIQGESGDWSVFENHFSFPPGISHVIQNRRMLAQAFPEVFEGHSVAPVAGFGSELVEALRGKKASRDQRIVLLTRGDTLRPHFDDSFLARHMGIVSARPADLIVRDGRVFLKTIDGLERVDVIMRKVETNAVDPITFVENPDRGVPGLVHCVRRGTVRVENVLGAEVADNRALLPFSDAIIRFYMNEEPILPTVETFHCFDRDQFEWVSSRPDEFLFDYVATPRVMISADDMGASNPQAVSSPLMKGPPEWTIARRKVKAARLPLWSDGGTAEAPFFLRIFGILRPRPVILPGGLSWQSGNANSIGFIGGMKDTWVIDERLGRATHQNNDLEEDLAPAILSAPSRVADGLYWMARYLERARNAAHQAGLLENIRLTELGPSDVNYYWPLWRGVAAAADFSQIADIEETPANFPRLFREFVGKAADPASVISSLYAARNNMDRIQEWVTPEMSDVFYQLIEEVEYALHRKGRLANRRNLDACLIVSREYSRFLGTMERTLSHDSVYRFWVLGSSIEWAIGSTLLLESIIPSRISMQKRHLEDDTDLTALLRLLGCLDAYRREYRSRAYLDRVIRLVWRNEDLPGSFLYNLFRIRDSLRAIEDDTPMHSNAPLRRRVSRMINRVENFPIEEVFPARMVHLDFGSGTDQVHAKTLRKVSSELEWLRKSLRSLHGQIEDRYFNHQVGR
ncbi:circularly permuted type 2 ATP-grasp protein [Puniceicoccus vermicola]|uniref:Circularly permuted type 2 ATP-grasp protein n=1 Tax=Puniceicoccus vermicola TaxID=388746 RepID=A0A7X1E5E0_9BACT|nr:circularly permuted type 2 ATP-grasp protein [Puniceicoccus vermicola]MBC2603066.1 circularly permuted type 2 ATP-grasp protein [Puniceicoccus vermicola]